MNNHIPNNNLFCKVLLSFVMLLMLGGRAAAQDKEAYSVFSDGTLTFYYDDNKPENAYPFGNVSEKSSEITKVVFDKSFADYRPTDLSFLFDRYINLTEIVDIEKYLNTTDVTDMNCMFSYCSSLTTLDVSNFNTGKVTDMSLMFYDCSSLTTLDVSNFNTENVMNMNELFNECSSLTKLDVSNFNTSSVTNMRFMFNYCEKLTEINVKNFITDNVQDMAWMFGSCSGLKELDVSNLNTQNVSDMAGMFEGCRGLTELDITNFNTENVTDISRFIGLCSNLTSIDLSNLNTNKVTDMSGMFFECNSLKSLDVSNFNTEIVTDMWRLFGGCDALTILDLRNFKTKQVEEMREMFSYCNNLTTIIVDENNWSTQSVDPSYNDWIGTLCTFDNSPNLIGNAGTQYDEHYYTDIDHTDIDYAHIDEGESNPGYFTTESYKVFYDLGDDGDWDGATPPTSFALTNTPELPIPNPINKKGLKFKGWYGTPITGLTEDNPQTDISIPAGAVGNRIYTAVWEDKEAYVVVSTDSTTLTFYYDDQRSVREGTEGWTHEIDERDENYIPMWIGYIFIGQPYQKAIFDESFRNAKPTSCESWFFRCNNLTTIDGIANLNTENVTDMSSMFQGCSGLTTLDVSNFNTKIVTDMYGMFDGCHNLITLDLSNFSTENVTNMNRMFENCNNITSLDLSNFNTENVTDMENMFLGCSSLTTLDVTNFNTKNVTNMYEMFRDCSSLTTLDLSNFNTENVTNMGGMFMFCRSLTTLDVSNFNTENVTDMSGMFYGCSSLTTIDVSNFNTENVTNMYGMFYDCSGLTSLDVSHFNTENVTDMYGMFDDCSSLNTIFVSDSWSTSSVTSSDIMFDGCNNLYGGQCSAYKQYQVSDASYARIDGGESAPGYFTRVGEPGCTNRNEAYVVVSTDSTTLYFYFDDQRKAREGVEGWTHGIEDKNDFGYLAWIMVDDPNYYPPYETIIFDTSFKDARPTSCATWFYCCINLTNIIGIENLHTDEVTEMQFMFFRCASLQNLDVSSFVTDKVTNMAGMFGGCIKIKNLDLSGFNTSLVTDMNSMFWNCDQLTELDLSNFNTENVTDMNSMFQFCNNLQNIKFGKFNTKNVKDMSHMFYECNKLESLDLSSFNTENVENMNTMFRQCHSLSTLDLHNFNTSKVTDMGHMFCESNFVELDLSNFNTEKVKDMSYMFGNCSYLKNINLSSFDTKNVENMEQMFCNCEQLEKLDLSNFNTENVTNMRGMFGAFWYEDGTRVGNGCNSLVSLDLSSFNTAKVTDMRSMFAYCSNLTAIVVDKNKWSTQSVSKTFDDVYGYKTPFENVINLIGNAGTLYDEKHTDIDYAHIDEGESNPGYLTTESYKVFYNLDGGDWNGVDYPKSFTIDLKENIQIPTPKKKGYRFLGWTGTLASGITGNTPIKNVVITPDKPGNRIYTAHWEEDNLDKTITFPSTPKEPEAFCNGDEKKVVLRYDTQVVYDVAKYKISLDDIITNEEEITEQNGEYQIDIPIPENTEPGTYSGKIEFYNANNAKTAEYPVKIQVAAAKNIILNLYEDVIFADNHSGLYAADGWQWYKNGEPIKNANRQYYFERPFKQGSYMVEMKTIKDGTTVYSCPIVVTHDILKNAKSPVTSYPNPAVGGKDVNLYIVDYNCETDYTIILSNTQGVIVRTINNAAETSTLSLPQGIYSGALISNGSKKGFKLIVK